MYKLQKMSLNMTPRSIFSLKKC